ADRGSVRSRWVGGSPSFVARSCAAHSSRESGRRRGGKAASGTRRRAAKAWQSEGPAARSPGTSDESLRCWSWNPWHLLVLRTRAADGPVWRERVGISIGGLPDAVPDSGGVLPGPVTFGGEAHAQSDQHRAGEGLYAATDPRRQEELTRLRCSDGAAEQPYQS